MGFGRADANRAVAEKIVENPDIGYNTVNQAL